MRRAVPQRGPAGEREDELNISFRSQNVVDLPVDVFCPRWRGTRNSSRCNMNCGPTLVGLGKSLMLLRLVSLWPEE